MGGEVGECITSNCVSVRTSMSNFNVRSGARLAVEPHLRSRKECATEQPGALSQHIHHEGANLCSQPLQHLRARTGSARRRLTGERNRSTGAEENPSVLSSAPPCTGVDSAHLQWIRQQTKYIFSHLVLDAGPRTARHRAGRRLCCRRHGKQCEEHCYRRQRTHRREAPPHLPLLAVGRSEVTFKLSHVATHEH